MQPAGNEWGSAASPRVLLALHSTLLPWPFPTLATAAVLCLGSAPGTWGWEVTAVLVPVLLLVPMLSSSSGSVKVVGGREWVALPCACHCLVHPPGSPGAMQRKGHDVAAQCPRDRSHCPVALGDGGSGRCSAWGGSWGKLLPGAGTGQHVPSSVVCKLSCWKVATKDLVFLPPAWLGLRRGGGVRQEGAGGLCHFPLS